MLTRTHSRARRRRGAALVEFMVILPVFSTALFGVLEFGRIFQQRILLTNACREGVRRAAVGEKTATIRTTVQNNAKSLGIAENQIAIEWNTRVDGTGEWLPAQDRLGSQGNAIPLGHLCRTRVTGWHHKMITGNYFEFIPGVDDGKFAMAAAEVMVRE